jgi:spore coat protein CotH
MLRCPDNGAVDFKMGCSHKMRIEFLTGLLLMTVWHIPVTAATDSSDLIFQDTAINKYNLTFYYPNWEDSLTYYKNADEQYIPASFTYYNVGGDSTVIDSVGVRYKGNSSYSFAVSKDSPKKPFKIKFSEYRDKQTFYNVDFLNLNNNAGDPSIMREKLSYDILRKYMPAPRAVYADLYVGGARIGLFTQVEEVDKKFLKLNYKKAQCNLYKCSDAGATLLYYNANQSSYTSEYELKTNKSVGDWSAFILFLSKLNNVPADSFAFVMNKCLDLTNSIWYTAFNILFSNFDSYTGSGRNFYMYDDSETGRFTLIPWDFNLSFGLYANGNWSNDTVDIKNLDNLSERPLTKRILENDSLLHVYYGCLKELIKGYGSPDSLTAMINRIKTVIDSSIKTDSNAFYTYDQFVRNLDTTVTVTAGITKSYIRGLKSLCVQRDLFILARIGQYLPVSYNVNVKADGSPSLECCGFLRNRCTIRYNVAENYSLVNIRIYDCTGRLRESFNEGTKKTGTYARIWNAENVPAGYYMVKVNIGVNTAMSGVILTK